MSEVTGTGGSGGTAGRHHAVIGCEAPSSDKAMEDKALSPGEVVGGATTGK
jgi:hypothetical protein